MQTTHTASPLRWRKIPILLIDRRVGRKPMNDGIKPGLLTMIVSEGLELTQFFEVMFQSVTQA